jgi:C-8 sterol isomerase
MAPTVEGLGFRGWLIRAVAFLAAITPIYYILEQNLDRFYIFDLGHLHDLSKRAIAQHGNQTGGIADFIVAELYEKYPSYVNLDREWVFNNAGGAMGAMFLIHASKQAIKPGLQASTSNTDIIIYWESILMFTGITEYLIIFGSAVGTEGHCGRHTADDYFYILTGTQETFVAGEYEPRVYPPGSVHFHARGDVKQYKMPKACFALEYARGWIPPMLFFGFADTFSSTLDFPTLYHTIRITGREMIGNLIRGKL